MVSSQLLAFLFTVVAARLGSKDRLIDCLTSEERKDWTHCVSNVIRSRWFINMREYTMPSAVS